MASPSKRQKVLDTRPRDEQQQRPKPKPSILARMPVDLRDHILGFGINHRERLRPSLVQIRSRFRRCRVCYTWALFNWYTATRPVGHCDTCRVFICEHHDEWYNDEDGVMDQPMCRTCYTRYRLEQDEYDVQDEYDERGDQ